MRKMNKKTSLQGTVKISENIIWREVSDEAVLLNVDTSNYYTLNTIGTEVWKMLCDKKKIEDVVSAMNKKYDEPEEKIARDVRSLLKELQEEKLIRME
jgi:sensor histidine kinase YesM